MAVRVVIADDHQLVLRSLRAALDADPGFEVVGETGSGSHVLPLVGRTTPDVVLMDIRMPGMDGLTCLDLLRVRHPATKVVLLSASEDREVIRSALSRGAAGYLVKSIDPDEIPAALRAAVNGTAFFAPAGGESPDEAAVRETGLTARELTLLRCVSRGMSNKQISQEQFITEQTVKFHLTNVYRKLAVSNRSEAVGWAHRHGLVTMEDGH